MEYLQLLSKEILKNVPEGLTKVKFAKVIYFTHKALVQKGLVKNDQLRFIRMPLGPVPCGFKDLIHDPSLTIEDIKKPQLSYDMQLYKLGKKDTTKNELSDAVQEIVNKIKDFPTSYLVEQSHKDPSWIHHGNGEEYVIEKEDLTLTFPSASVSQPDTATEAMRLQAKLMEGMLDEIVEESTSLEYPKETN